MIPFDTELSAQQIGNHLTEISQRQLLQPGHRQVPFNRVETLLCYGLFYMFDPHKYGGSNIDKVPTVVKTLATFFRRTPGSITNKMLNLDGSRQHSGRNEPLLFASLATEPTLYHAIYKDILTTARAFSISEEILPDFLGVLSDDTQTEDLLGQDDLPINASVLLAGEESSMKALDYAFELGDRLTEKLVERKIRLAQHRFAIDVIQNCGRSCVFCGFAPRTLPNQSGLLRASHSKPWAVSAHRERFYGQTRLS